MELLTILEKKIHNLLSLVQDFSQKNKYLTTQNESLRKELEELKCENAKFAEDNAQQAAQLKAIEDSLQKENTQSGALQKEKSLAKLVVDDLIKSIDALIEQEIQQ